MQKKKYFIENIIDFFRETIDFLFHRKVSVVIPAFNEDENVAKVVKTALLPFEVSEVIVVDDGSTDNTAEVAKKAGAIVVKHEKNMGKGAAIKTGLKHAKEDVILFLDADLKNIGTEQIKKLFNPALSGEADFVKAGFARKAGRVTELTAKPLLKYFFPRLKFEQPLSGQFCGRKKVFDGIKIEKGWGTDIGILLDIAAKKFKIKEVDIGEIEHDSKQLHELKPMAEAVSKVIMKKAGIKKFKAKKQKK